MSPFHERPWTNLYPPAVRQMHSTPDMSLGQLLATSRERFADRTAMTFEGRTWSFEQLHRQAHAFARLLVQEGIRPGDRVAIVLPNRPEYVVAIFGIVLAGGIVVQINNRYPAEEMRRILDDSGASVVITTDETAQRCSTADPDFLGRKLVRVDTAEERTFPSSGIPFNRLSEFLGLEPLDIAADPLDVAVLQYTGGTTGAAKGVMLTHRNLIANIEQRYAVTYGLLDVPEGAKTINVLPMCHVFRTDGSHTPRHPLWNEPAAHPRVPGLRDAHNDQGRETLRLQRCPHHVHRAEPRTRRWLQRAGRGDHLQQRRGGFPLEQIEQFERNSGGRIIEGFGISEASPSTHLNPLFAPRKVGSIGIPLPLTDVRVVNQDGGTTDELPSGEIGEMIVRGPQVMKGYWNRPEQTQKHFVTDGC